MKISPQAAVAAAPQLKTNSHNELNPAKQAKAADPAVKGAEFGHLVASFAHAKHAPAPTSLTPPITETPPTDEAAPAEEAGATEPSEAAAVDETSNAEAPPEETSQSGAPPAGDPSFDVEAQLLAELLADSEPGDTLDLTA